MFTCARPLVGQFVAIQLVGVEGSLSLCEVEVFTNDEFSPDRCASPGLSADTILSTFSRNCYEFHVTRGENFDSARKICKSHGGDLVHSFRGPTQDYILSELERRKPDLRTQLVWIGAQKEPGITSRTWKWVNGKNSRAFRFLPPCRRVSAEEVFEAFEAKNRGYYVSETIPCWCWLRFQWMSKCFSVLSRGAVQKQQ